MSEETFKGRICQEMIKAAKKYKEIYVDYEYLICSDAFVQRNYYIVDAKEDNFQHLTGVHSLITPQKFFDKCYDGTLKENDFDFIKKGQDEKDVKGTVRRKIKVLPDMMKLFRDGLQTEENYKKNKIFCSFATADGNCTLGFSESEKAKPKTLIKGNGLKNPQKVELILRKEAGDLKFDEIVTGSEQSLAKYREKIQNMLADNLRQDSGGEHK